MSSKEPRIVLRPCPKGWREDLDKSVSPGETFRKVSEKLASLKLDIVADTVRVDTGRLGIPVYLGVCGSDARRIMPVRKQMGKGSSVAQARASALMELMERYAFFSFWERRPHFERATWREAEKKFGAALISPEEILRSVHDDMDGETFRELFSLCEWDFYPATRLTDGETVWLPLDWFRMLGEFNGSSAGNSAEESLLQGLCELVERHVCCIADRERPALPTLDTGGCDDPALARLEQAFERAGIRLVLKDFSMGTGLPTVGALAWDPATFPEKSEIVLTAGTATSPAKAAIRAITEVAQLGGDFCTSSCYEASGLPKFHDLAECRWLLEGPRKSVADLPDASGDDIRAELETALENLRPINVYGIETTSPDIGVPAHYCVAPGLEFRERDVNQSAGLFVGRKLAEQCAPDEAGPALDRLAALFPDAHYLPFFRGLLALRLGDAGLACDFFTQAVPAQPEAQSRALAAFYLGYARSLAGKWEDALPHLSSAFELCPDMKEYGNYLGAALFRLGRYAEAEEVFDRVLRLDKGSAMDLANRGLCRERLGRNDAARKDLSAALSLDPSIDFAREHLDALELK